MTYIEPKITWTYLSHIEGDKYVYYRTKLTLGEALTAGNVDLRTQAQQYLDNIIKQLQNTEDKTDE